MNSEKSIYRRIREATDRSKTIPWSRSFDPDASEVSRHTKPSRWHQHVPHVHALLVLSYILFTVFILFLVMARQVKGEAAVISTSGLQARPSPAGSSFEPSRPMWLARCGLF